MLRPVDLKTEIKQHLMIWKTDSFFKKIDKSIQTSIKGLIDLIEIVESNPQAVVDNDKKTPVEIKMAQSFIGLFQKAYKELIGQDCQEVFNGIAIKIYAHQMKRIMESYGTVEDYVDWLFHDFFLDKKNQHLLPPRANFCMSQAMIDRFLFVKKDELMAKKKSNQETEQRMEFVNILRELYNLFKS
jgi:hypothetical protein